MSVNKVFFIGNVGQDPEIRVNGEIKYANFSLATKERGFTTKNNIEVPERTDWHRIVASGWVANIVESYVNKGSLLHIEGKLRTRSYTASDNTTRYVTEVYASSIELLGKPNTSQQTAAPAATQTTTQQTDIPPANESDDLPF